MNNIRHSAVAGSFYPADPVQLKSNILALLHASATSNTCVPANSEHSEHSKHNVQPTDAQKTVTNKSTAAPSTALASTALASTALPSIALPKAIIAPHAGYIYSGPIAARIYAQFMRQHNTIKRIVLLGPSHKVYFKGIAASTKSAYQTPLGRVPIDQKAIQTVLATPQTGYLDAAHTDEHSLEVHLPFLQCLFDEFSIVPLVIGDTNKEAVARVIEQLWGGNETLIIVSSDLSHFLQFDAASSIDSNTARKILDLESDLTAEEACGYMPVNGLLHFVAQQIIAQKKDLKIELVDLRNSADTAGAKDRVVGYGAFNIFEPLATVTTGPKIPIAIRQQIIQVARQAILHPLLTTRTASDPVDFKIELNQFAVALRDQGACFITLKIDHQLRGCIGTLKPHRALILDVASNAQAAAFKDPRFKPLTLAEFPQIELHASILAPAETLNINSKQDLLEKIRPGVDGLIIEEQGKTATYLPSVWQQLPAPDDFITQLRLKAGLDPKQWGQCRVQRYTTEEFV
ncbi:MAG: AmmeMemoRadiSam system protein B [Pseudomonadales bacterium]|nr:AmmeMemoRadiSam system protein B [Pseudomonadales bacterium]